MLEPPTTPPRITESGPRYSGPSSRAGPWTRDPEARMTGPPVVSMTTPGSMTASAAATILPEPIRCASAVMGVSFSPEPSSRMRSGFSAISSHAASSNRPAMTCSGQPGGRSPVSRAGSGALPPGIHAPTISDSATRRTGPVAAIVKLSRSGTKRLLMKRRGPPEGSSSIVLQEGAPVSAKPTRCSPARCPRHRVPSSRSVRALRVSVPKRSSPTGRVRLKGCHARATGSS